MTATLIFLFFAINTVILAVNNYRLASVFCFTTLVVIIIGEVSDYLNVQIIESWRRQNRANEKVIDSMAEMINLQYKEIDILKGKLKRATGANDKKT
jgi:ABC-type bacteriocin/lantibiotic exporter with double-glycine peptidase domain